MNRCSRSSIVRLVHRLTSPVSTSTVLGGGEDVGWRDGFERRSHRRPRPRPCSESLDQVRMGERGRCCGEVIEPPGHPLGLDGVGAPPVRTVLSRGASGRRDVAPTAASRDAEATRPGGPRAPPVRRGFRFQASSNRACSASSVGARVAQTASWRPQGYRVCRCVPTSPRSRRVRFENTSSNCWGDAGDLRDVPTRPPLQPRRVVRLLTEDRLEPLPPHGRAGYRRLGGRMPTIPSGPVRGSRSGNANAATGRPPGRCDAGTRRDDPVGAEPVRADRGVVLPGEPRLVVRAALDWIASRSNHPIASRTARSLEPDGNRAQLSGDACRSRHGVEHACGLWHLNVR